MLRRSFLRRTSSAAGLKLLLAPLLKGTSGPVVEKLGLGAHLPTVTLAGPAPSTASFDAAKEEANETFFGCSWDGAVGFDPAIVENYFIVLTTGFDVLAFDADAGHMDIKHARRFLGWKPDDKVLRVDFEATCVMNAHTDKVKYVHFQSRILPVLQAAECPKEILTCLTRPESMKMLIALRRSKVRAEYITHAALSSATKKTDSWSSALGIL